MIYVFISSRNNVQCTHYLASLSFIYIQMQYLTKCEDNSQTVTVPFQQGAVNFVLTHNLVTNEKAFD